MASAGSSAIKTPDKNGLENGHQLLLLVLSVVFSVITGLCIAFRIYSRACVVGKIFMEDVLITIGAVLAIALSATYAVGAFHGLGKHIWQVIAHPSDFILVYKLAFVVTFQYTGANLFVKCSFLALYLRLDSRTPMRWAVYFLFFLEMSQFVASCVVLGLAWISPEHLLDGQHSILGLGALQDFYNANDILCSVTSAAIYITPMFMLRGLPISKRQKYAVGALFSLGFLSTAAACIKTYYAWNLIRQIDIYYKITNAILWIQVEVHSAIICGSAQTFRSLLRGFCPNCCRSPTTVNSEQGQQASPILIACTDPSAAHGSNQAFDYRSRESSWHNRGVSELRAAWIPAKEVEGDDFERRRPQVTDRLSNVWRYSGKRFTHGPDWPLRQ